MDWIAFTIALVLGLLWGITISRGRSSDSPEEMLRMLLVDAVKKTRDGSSYFLTICVSKRGNDTENQPDLSMMEQNWRDQ